MRGEQMSNESQIPDNVIHYLQETAPRLIEHHWDRWRQHYKDFIYPHTLIIIVLAAALQQNLILELPWAVVIGCSIFTFLWFLLAALMLIRVHSDMYSMYHTCIWLEEQYALPSHPWGYRQALLEKDFRAKIRLLARLVPKTEVVGTLLMTGTLFLFSALEILVLLAGKLAANGAI